ncbi:MAG: alpha-hydroxy-acid oxidizing protein [Verrucomicrobia bacterium]|nr:MAG: alpha-hydroxy-acid oxidizing protein [Verrucomicrobiota bacterium]
MPLSRRKALVSTSTLVGAAFLLPAKAQSPAARSPGTATPPLADLVSVSDFEPLAEERLSEVSRALVKGGAADELTVRWNREAFDQIRLRPRVLVDVSRIDTGLTLLGQRLPFPILLAPTAYHAMVHPGGEAETARGAGKAGALWVVSSATNTRLDAIARAATGPLWFQLYVQSDRRFVTDVVHEAEAAGCRALVVTVDAPVVGPRYRQMRAKFKLSPGLSLPYMDDVNKGRDSLLRGGNTRMTWAEIEWLQSVTRLPVLLKGILNPDDAERAVASRVAGIIVSNHGGRMLDTAPATIAALPAVTERVAGRIPVLVDGGVRRGTDILKALAFGANAVLIGRPYLHGLAAAGADGVARVVALLRDELEQAMALTGRPTLADIDRSVIWG